MSYSAQASLRRTMEQYSSKCKFISWCESLSKVIDPLKSRCMCIRVSAPSNTLLFRYLLNIANKEKFNINLKDYVNIVNKAKEILKNPRNF